MIIIGVVGTGEKRHASVIEKLKEQDDHDVEIREIARSIGNPNATKERYYRDQLKQLKREGFDGVAVFTNVIFHDEFLALAAAGATMWHLVSSISDSIPIRLNKDILLSLTELQKRPHYKTPSDALNHTIDNAIER